jgi:hypothetical protein
MFIEVMYVLDRDKPYALWKETLIITTITLEHFQSVELFDSQHSCCDWLPNFYTDNLLSKGY